MLFGTSAENQPKKSFVLNGDCSCKPHCVGSILGGGLEHFLCFHILGRIIPTDFHIFQRGRYTTNQLVFPTADAIFFSFPEVS